MAKKSKEQSFASFLEKLKNDKIEARKIESIEERRFFLIVSEGIKTEPNYFNYFKKFLPKHLLETVEVHGAGDNTINVVQRAIELRNIRDKNTILPNYDEVWAVYDKDDFPSQDFNAAVQLAANNNIESGHSNQSFELWYVLHFQFLQNALHRDDYIKILSKELGFKYKKNNLTVIDFLFKNGNVVQAIKWAQELEKNHFGATPSESCPHTRIHVLVERLRKYLKLNI